MRKCPEERVFISARIGAKLRRTVAARMDLYPRQEHETQRMRPRPLKPRQTGSYPEMDFTELGIFHAQTLQ